jgi:hypothetical protein
MHARTHGYIQGHTKRLTHIRIHDAKTHTEAHTYTHTRQFRIVNIYIHASSVLVWYPSGVYVCAINAPKCMISYECTNKKVNGVLVL